MAALVPPLVAAAAAAARLAAVATVAPAKTRRALADDPATLPINGEPQTVGNGGTIGFACDTPEKVDAWHAAGVENGGASCEDPPGIRQGPAGQLYLAYLRDPDGNKLCASYRFPKPAAA